MDQILSEGWGSQCTKRPPDTPGEPHNMSDDCKIH
jgi:hypothetical protein